MSLGLSRLTYFLHISKIAADLFDPEVLFDLELDDNAELATETSGSTLLLDSSSSDFTVVV